MKRPLVAVLLLLALVALLPACVSAGLAEENLSNVLAKDRALAGAGVPDPAPTAAETAKKILDDAAVAAAIEAALAKLPFVPPPGTIPWTELAVAAIGLFTGGKTALRVMRSKKTAPSTAPPTG